MNTHLSKLEKETKDLAGSLLGKHRDTLRKRALLFALEGELGAGKTVFAKGVGEYLGIKKPIRSPGFVLVAEYPYFRPADSSTRRVEDPKPDGFSSAGKLFHVDLWRIEDEGEARALRIEEMVKPGNIILIEWAQKVPNLMKELEERNDLAVVKLEFIHKGEKKRVIRITNN